MDTLYFSFSIFLPFLYLAFNFYHLSYRRVANFSTITVPPHIKFSISIFIRNAIPIAEIEKKFKEKILLLKLYCDFFYNIFLRSFNVIIYINSILWYDNPFPIRAACLHLLHIKVLLWCYPLTKFPGYISYASHTYGLSFRRAYISKNSRCPLIGYLRSNVVMLTLRTSDCRL